MRAAKQIRLHSDQMQPNWLNRMTQERAEASIRASRHRKFSAISTPSAVAAAVAPGKSSSSSEDITRSCCEAERNWAHRQKPATDGASWSSAQTRAKRWWRPRSCSWRRGGSGAVSSRRQQRQHHRWWNQMASMLGMVDKVVQVVTNDEQHCGVEGLIRRRTSS